MLFLCFYTAVVPSIGPLEILVLTVIALIVFGPQRLPEIGRTIGKTLAELRRMASDVRSEFETGMNLDEVEDVPEHTEPAPPASTATDD